MTANESYTIEGKKVDAQRFLNELLYKLESGTYVEPSKITLGKYLEYWLKNIKPTVKATTHPSYSSTAYNFIIPSIAKIPTSKLTHLHIQQLITDVQNVGSRADNRSGKLSSRSVSYILTVLNIALGQAVKVAAIGP